MTRQSNNRRISIPAGTRSTGGTRSPSHDGSQPHGGFQSLEARRLMSASVSAAALTVFDGETLSLRGQQSTLNDMHVELDADGSHVRGIVNGQAGQWQSLASVRRISISGSDDFDFVTIDARLGGKSTPVGLDADVEHVTIRPVVSFLEMYRRSWAMQEGHRLARQVGESTDTARIIVSNPQPAPLEDITQTTRPDADVERAQVPKIAKFMLVDADTGEVIPGHTDLASGDSIDMNLLVGRRVNIHAVLEGGEFAGSVLFEAGEWKQVENWEPFAVYGDNDGDFNPWSPEPGTYTLKATVYSGKNATGSKGQTYEVNLQFLPPDPIVDPGVGNGGNTDGGAGGETGGGGDNGETTPPALPQPSDGERPLVRIDRLAGVVYAGQSVHFNGLNTVLNHGELNDASFEWDFGDAGSRFNSVRGFVAAHAYHNPGNYTVTLRVTDETGRVGTQTLEVTVAAASRTQIYVSNSGNDANNGRSAGSAVRTAGRAMELMEALGGNHVEILFARGQNHGLSQTMEINGSDVIVGAYGSGTKPKLVWNGGSGSMIAAGGASRQVTVRDLAFTDPTGDAYGKSGRPTAISTFGQGIAVIGNTFYDVQDGVNANGKPTGLLVQDNEAPSVTGIRSYFVWGEGKQLTILGNTVANSTREHIIRIGGAEGVTIAGNDLTNLDRRDQGDQSDIAKGVIVMQKGKFGYATDNHIRSGGAGVGPLGEGDGLNHTWHRWEYAVWENNTLHDETFYVEHGAEHVDFRYNVLEFDNKWAIQIEGWQSDYQRTSTDITIHGNVVINNGTQGQFLHTWSGVRDIEVTNNVFIAPNLNFGPYQSAAIAAESLDGFLKIDGNLWPQNNGDNWANGGVHYVGQGNVQSNYMTPSQWLAYDVVGNDSFGSADPAGTVAMVLNQHGVPVAMAA